MTHYLKDEDDEGNMLKEGDRSKIETKSAATRKKRENIMDESHVHVQLSSVEYKKL